MELSVNKKKEDMLQDPSAYLLQRIKELLKLAAGTSNIYKEMMKDVVKAVAGTSDQESEEYKATAGQPWVKSLACDLAAKVKSVELGVIDIKYPILERPRSPRTLESWKPKRSLSRKGVSNYIHN